MGFTFSGAEIFKAGNARGLNLTPEPIKTEAVFINAPPPNRENIQVLVT